jgi:hypothetical protein
MKKLTIMNKFEKLFKLYMEEVSTFLKDENKLSDTSSDSADSSDSSDSDSSTEVTECNTARNNCSVL